MGTVFSGTQNRMCDPEDHTKVMYNRGMSPGRQMSPLPCTPKDQVSSDFSEFFSPAPYILVRGPAVTFPTAAEGKFKWEIRNRARKIVWVSWGLKQGPWSSEHSAENRGLPPACRMQVGWRVVQGHLLPAENSWWN